MNLDILSLLDKHRGTQRFMAVLPKPRIGIDELQLSSRIKDTVY